MINPTPQGRPWKPVKFEAPAGSRRPLPVLERGIEVLESIGNRVSMAVDRESFFSEPVPAQIASLGFLTRYSVAAGEKRTLDSAIRQIHRLCHSPLYDAVEGGFFEGVTHGKTRTSKLLSHNAQWLMLVLGTGRDPEAAFALSMARGILHYLQERLLLPAGWFADSQCEGPEYYALSGEGRRRMAPPPVDPTLRTASNALALQALCESWWRLGEAKYLQQALETSASLEGPAPGSKGAPASTRGRRSQGPGGLEDIVQMGLAHLALYHSTLGPRHLDGVARMARRIAGSLKKPAGTSGSLMGQEPDPAYPAKAARFLLVAAAQLEDESLSVPARGLLNVLAASPSEDLEALALLGDALMAALSPMAIFEAVTDGSEAQRSRVLERLRQVGPCPAVITHRLHAPREGMQRLPRLVGYCGGNRHEVPV